jgi:hypothetical protein
MDRVIDIWFFLTVQKLYQKTIALVVVLLLVVSSINGASNILLFKDSNVGHPKLHISIKVLFDWCGLNSGALSATGVVVLVGGWVATGDLLAPGIIQIQLAVRVGLT